MNDIDLSAYDSWDPIGEVDADTGVTSGFFGSFDGNGYTIKNLTINRPDETTVGLFSVIGTIDDDGNIIGGEVKNLGLVNVDVNGGAYVGGLAAGSYGSIISNCFVTGNVSGDVYTGGIVGFNTAGTVSNSYATGLVQGTTAVGELVGNSNQSTLQNSIWNKDSTSQNTYGEDSDVDNPSTLSNVKELSSAEMNDPNNWASWDSDIWDFSSYPPTFKMYTPIDAAVPDPDPDPVDPDTPSDSSNITGSVNANDEPDQPFSGQNDGEIIFSDGTTVHVSETDSRTDVLDKINDAGLDASIDSDGHIVIKKPDGSDISIKSDSSGFSQHYGLPVNNSGGSENGGNGGSDEKPSITPAGSIRLQIGYDEKNTSVI